MGEYQRLPNCDDLCLDHIKLYDRYFEHWSDDLPNRALSNRATKHTHIKHIYGQSLPITILFCIHRSSAVYRPTIGRQSGVFLGRATIGRRSDDRSLIVIHVYMYTYHTTRTVCAKDVASLTDMVASHAWLNI